VRIRLKRETMKGLWIAFCVLILVSLSADLIANDKPLLVIHKRHVFCPIFQNLSTSDFGFKEERPVYFYDSEQGHSLLKQSSFVLHPLIHFGPNTIDMNLVAPHPPTQDHWLGTDDHGRDIVVRLLYGLRLSMLFGLSLAFCGIIIGLSIGGIQGYMGGTVDITVGRLVELWTSIPSMFLVLIIVSITQPNFWLLLGICLLFNWVQVAAVTRAEFLRIREQDYVRAAEVMGLSRGYIMIRHILPNAIFGILVFFPYLFTNAIIQLTALTFLGFGLPPETASLGDLLNQAKDNLGAPWIGMSAIVTLVAVLTLLMTISEQLRNIYKKSNS